MKTKALTTSAFLSCVLWFLCSFNRTNKKEGVEKKSYDVIIVPGVPFNQPSFKLVMKSRILWAKYLFNKKIAKNIIFSGSSVYTPYVEGDIMRMYADALNIPSENTFSETQAEHSTENVYYSLLMAKKLGFKKIAVATDKYQAMIIRKFIKNNCPEVEVITIEYDKINLFNAPWPTIDPTPAHVDCFVSLVEREGKFKRLKGTMGKNIKPENNYSTTAELETKLNSFTCQDYFFSSFHSNDSLLFLTNCEPVAVR